MQQMWQIYSQQGMDQNIAGNMLLLLLLLGSRPNSSKLCLTAHRKREAFLSHETIHFIS
jgi:hypothetical protein